MANPTDDDKLAHAREQAQSQYESIVEMIAALECDYDRLEELRDEPLSVEIRSGWYSPGDKPEPEEFCILLCTGGPACRIRWTLNDHNEPKRAWIEFQDWFTPWTEFVGADQDTLLTYARQFFYGE